MVLKIRPEFMPCSRLGGVFPQQKLPLGSTVRVATAIAGARAPALPVTPATDTAYAPVDQATTTAGQAREPGEMVTPATDTAYAPVDQVTTTAGQANEPGEMDVPATDPTFGPDESIRSEGRPEGNASGVEGALSGSCTIGTGLARSQLLTTVSAAALLAEDIPQRDWIFGQLLLSEAVSMVVGPPGSGKSTYALMSGCAVAAGKEWNGDEVPFARSVIYVSAEDSRHEVARRLEGIRQVMGIGPDALARFHVVAGQPIQIGAGDDVAGAMSSGAGELLRLVSSIGAAVVIIDPLVEAHGCDENNNAEMHRVIATLRTIAQRGNCSVLVVHHAGKGIPIAGDQNLSRGASSVVGGVRAIRTILPIDETVAGQFGISPELASGLVRVDGAKTNYSSLGGTTVLRMLGVTINNGDTVGVLEPVPIQTAPGIENRSPPAPDRHAIALAAAEMIVENISVNKFAELLLRDRPDLFPGVTCKDPSKPSEKVRNQIISAIQSFPDAGLWTLRVYEMSGRGGNGKSLCIEKIVKPGNQN